MESHESQLQTTAIHRLFVGLPVPKSAGNEIISWANTVVPPEYGRTLSPDSLYVSVAFFGTATSAHRAELIEVVNRMTIERFAVETEVVTLCRHGALALDLNSKCWEPYFRQITKWPVPERPTGKFYQIEKELGTHYERHDIPHVTFARIPKKNRGTELKFTPPVFHFDIASICLYESTLQESGSHYKIIAENSKTR